MTAPPAPMPLFTFSDAHLHAAASSSFLSPALTASSPSFSWPSMAPIQGSHRPPSQPKSMSPPSNERRADSNDLLFITGNKPADFKSKKTMTKVRKQAMGSYLKDKKPRDASRERQQRSREGSAGSRTSAASEQYDVISNREALRILKRGKRRTAQAESPAENVHTRREPTPKTKISKLPSMANFVLPSAPMVMPMRTGIKLPYDGVELKPFQSLGKPLDPFRSMFQASHPRVSVEELKWHCSRSFGTKAMGEHWIPTLIKSPQGFLSTLCVASAHNDAINERPTSSVQTLALRQEVMHLISQGLLNPNSRVGDFNIIALTQLVASVVISSEEMALNFHETGVEAMIKQRGGLNQLGVNGRLASTISWVSLESAILREAKPRSIYSDFCSSNSSKPYPNTATVPESPLFCPRAEFETIRRSPRCLPRTMDLLKDIRMMMDLFLHETKQSRLNSLSLKNIYKKITSHPSAAELQKTNVLTSNDWKYEAIRLASIVTATAILQRVPLSEAVRYAAEVENPITLYTIVSASHSSESLASLTNPRHDSPLTSFSTSPSYATASSPAFETANPFTFKPSKPRNSFSSSTSDSGFFPAPQPQPRSNSHNLLANLKTALQYSNLSDCWADMGGVLLWVGLTVGAASRTGDKVFKKWFRALAMRVSIVLCFEHPEAVHASMLRMSEVVEGVGYAGASSTTNSAMARRESHADSGKRRRV